MGEAVVLRVGCGNWLVVTLDRGLAVTLELKGVTVLEDPF